VLKLSADLVKAEEIDAECHVAASLVLRHSAPAASDSLSAARPCH